MRELRKGGTITTVNGDAVDYFYYPERTAGDMIEIEKLASEAILRSRFLRSSSVR